MSAELDALCDQWLAWDANERTRAEVQRWRAAGDVAALAAAMRPRIAFGTAGLRGRMCAGFANMNGASMCT